jgi:hypothetical protein
MPERCDFCKKGPLYDRYTCFKKGKKPPESMMYETLDFKDTALYKFGDAAIICKQCANELRKTLTEFWDKRIPDHYKCGCLDAEMNIALSKYRLTIEKRTDMPKYWQESIEYNQKKIAECKEPEHNAFLLYRETPEFTKTVKEYVEPWENNFQTKDPIVAEDGDDLSDDDYEEEDDDE